MPNCFIVLGTPRSGTSAVAGILHRYGIYMGEGLKSANEMNPTGFHQDREFESILMRTIGEEYIPLYPYEVNASQVEDLKDLIEKRVNMNQDWGFKCIHLVYWLSEFVTYCKNSVKIILTQRVLNHSIDSMARWESQEAANTMIQNARKAIDSAMMSITCPRITIKFDDLIAQPTQQIQRIGEFIEKDFNPEIVSFIDPTLKHYG